ncbi:hypothetical protein TMEN_5048 [Trichophyton mentagrophytes]|uniref:Uncharacterized protein n=1 Tax=Trichophyton interdigitale (strain MR816) TaxID=1215338 RepID=A0A059J1J4_TRIIM|nr:hypothetical protein H101_07893 [Trichophyton interdigitale H6]KAG5202707.1 IgA-specific serine endopeptidase autotransporter [Trichophyton interdigitale]KDB21741.1 hypothetical protein H109_06344 [Trichophyton interdigitale MR816]GBF62503.1 hypothetical protein TMEN_5048 [Trichophyton mentagrophytes]KAG5216568.1 IgA-specific serine endopeptidase autotransporter [Trichophyton interdigitale]
MACTAIQPPSLSSSLSTLLSAASYTSSISNSNSNKQQNLDSRSYQTKMWRGYGFGSSAASSPVSPPSSFPQPAPPPPSPCDGLLDIYPRKTSFSTISGSNTSCAFPSWPNRSSLYSGSEEGSHGSASAYLSDEDLFPISSTSSSSNPMLAAMETPFGSDSFDDNENAIIGNPELTTEEQIRHMNETEDWRMRQYVQAQAQARALQALRAAQLAAVEHAQASRQRKKRASGSSSKKRRAHRGSAAVAASSGGSSSSSTSASSKQ